MLESALMNEIRKAISPYGTYFRANVGTGYTGNEIIRTDGGGVYIPKARPFQTGLPKGFPDVFGLTPVMITPGMIGQTLPVFTGLEIKTPTGRIRPDQKNMIDFLVGKGAKAGIVRSVDGAINIVGGEP